MTLKTRANIRLGTDVATSSGYEESPAEYIKTIISERGVTRTEAQRQLYEDLDNEKVYLTPKFRLRYNTPSRRRIL